MKTGRSRRRGKCYFTRGSEASAGPTDNAPTKSESMAATRRQSGVSRRRGSAVGETAVNSKPTVVPTGQRERAANEEAHELLIEKKKWPRKRDTVRWDAGVCAAESSAAEPERAASAVEPVIAVIATELAMTVDAKEPMGGNGGAAGKGGVLAELKLLLTRA